ncbi:hypothetical protein HZC31_00955 [Candidatus Woesearchaeota archaeon]|nr:hypothetical protein [Candidatus Woesearchaeota archaeon]
MADITSLIDAGFRALDSGDYTAALSSFTPCISEGLPPAPSFNIQYGLALSYFGLYRQNSDTAALENAIAHGEQAAEVYERRYDLQLLLGQCYAAQHQQTQELSLKDKAQHAYNMSRTYIPKTVGSEERIALDERINILLLELEGN